MNFDEYQAAARTTKNYPEEIGLLYAALGLCGEAGEVANKVKKIYRDNGGILADEMRDAILSEASDCAWYLAALCDELGVSMEKMITLNLSKLAARSKSGTIHGSGDHR